MDETHEPTEEPSAPDGWGERPPSPHDPAAGSYEPAPAGDVHPGDPDALDTGVVTPEPYPGAYPPPAPPGGYGPSGPYAQPGGPTPPGGWGGPPSGGSGGGRDPYWEPQPPRHGSVSVAVTALLVAVAVLAGVGIGRSLPANGSSAQVGSPTTTTPLGSGNSGGVTNPLGSGSGSSGTGGTGPSDVSAIAAKIDRSLVDIDTNLSYEGEEAAGTGIILSTSGLVLTNNHVIDGATTLKVTDVASGKQYTGTVVGYDEHSDVAVVQIDGASGLRPAPLDTSSTHVGQNVVAVGNAGGKGGTPTPAGGTITALHQSITASDEGNDTTEKLAGLIQTDADVQPGDSGGSLVNTKAQVIGMNTAASDSFSFTTTGDEGFAIPIDTALGIAHQIESRRASSTVHIGATAFIGVEVAPSKCTENGPSLIPQGTGALVCKVVGSAASRAGLATDDVITSVGGTSVSTPSALTRALVAYHPGETESLGYRTLSGVKHSTTITFGSGPPG